MVYRSDLSPLVLSADAGAAHGEQSKQPMGERDRGEVASKAGKPVGESTWREVRRSTALRAALFSCSFLIFMIQTAGQNQVAKEKR